VAAVIGDDGHRVDAFQGTHEGGQGLLTQRHAVVEDDSLRRHLLVLQGELLVLLCQLGSQTQGFRQRLRDMECRLGELRFQFLPTVYQAGGELWGELGHDNDGVALTFLS